MKYTSTTKKSNGQHGTITLSVREYKKMYTHLKNEKKREKRGLDGNRNLKSSQSNAKKQMMEKTESTENDLDTIQSDEMLFMTVCHNLQ